MANGIQDDPSGNSIVGRSVISPPPPYTSIELKNEKHYHHRQTVDDTVSKMQEVVENTYLMMQDLQNRLVRLECSNQLFTTDIDSAPRIHNNSANPLHDDSHSTDDHDYTDILDTMAYTVQQLLKEAQASLDRTIILPSTAATTPTNTTKTTPSMTFDQQSRYIASERKLDRAFELLMDQVCNTNFNDDGVTLVPAATQSEMGIKNSPSPTPSPIGKGVNLDYHHHYHHHHHHYHHHHYHDNHCPPSTSLPRSGTSSSVIATSTMTIDHPEYASSSFDTTNTVLSTATTKSVQLVQSWLSPLHRFTSLSPPTNNPPASSISTLPLSPSASSSTSTSTSTTISVSLSSAQAGKGYKQRPFRIRLHRTIWVLLVTSRLLLEQHYRSHSSFLHSNMHLLQPRHRHLWYTYKSILFGSSSSWSVLCRQMCRFIFIIQFIYHIIST